MRKIVILFICFILNVPLLTEADSDTTYGRIRIKKKSTSGDDSESGGSSEGGGFLGSCMGNCLSDLSGDCLSGCINGIFSSVGNIASASSSDQSDSDRQPYEKRTTVAENSKPCGYSTSPLHFSCGIVIGGIIYSKSIAAGFVPGGVVALTWFPDTFFGVRLSLEPSAALDNILLDMERDVFVDGTPIGTTVFSGESGKGFILPLTGQVLFVPPTPSRSLYLAFGGGACYKREAVRGKQSLNGTVSNRTVTFSQWCPAFRFGIGICMPLDEIHGVLEFSYTLMSHENSNMFETPGDNSRYGHMPTISFSISIP